ncbi:MAG: NAD(P)/FAD-dependent oxidoreductase [Bacteroidota bacterium]
MDSNYKILIAGAGPAGIATSLILSKNKIKHVLIEKQTFPRDKICGDALSGKVVSELNKIDPSYIREITANSSEYTGSYGVRFFSPGGKMLDVPFSSNPEKLKHAPGFISPRFTFDNFLFSKANPEFTDIRQNTSIENVYRKNNRLHVKMNCNGILSDEEFDIAVGAEGDRSVIAKELVGDKKENEHYCAGLRTYYENVSECHPDNFIELHFLKELLPGYFWIFPMNDGRVNVGIGMLSSYVSKRKVNLRKSLEEIISSHPVISKRFSAAKIITPIQGWGLPLGSVKRKISGANFLLAGDAGSLIDPFTGEGIGNALVSGRIAGETIVDAIKAGRFDSEFLSSYHEKVYHQLESEINLSHKMQKLARYESLFNFVVNKAISNQTLRETITCMFEDLDIRARLKKPSFYFKLLFNKP